jgi:hypothetical protein
MLGICVSFNPVNPGFHGRINLFENRIAVNLLGWNPQNFGELKDD